MSFDPGIPEQLFDWVLEEVAGGNETPEVQAAIGEIKSSFARTVIKLSGEEICIHILLSIVVRNL